MTSTGLFESIVPAGVAVAQSELLLHDEAALYPTERAAVTGSVEARRREFAAGRSCARRALAQLRLEPMPLLASGSREPVWPPGVAGSITHCAGNCAAAACWLRQVGSIGIDMAAHEPLPTDVAAVVASPKERARLNALDGGEVAWGTLLFSVKESVYKAWFPLTRAWLDFTDAEVELEPANHSFVVRLAPAAAATLNAIDLVRGRYIATARWLATCAVIPAGGPGSLGP